MKSSKKQAHFSPEGYLLLKINLFCFLWKTGFLWIKFFEKLDGYK